MVLTVTALHSGKWGISVFVVLLIRSTTVLACALVELARSRTNPWGNRCAPLPCHWLHMPLGDAGERDWSRMLFAARSASKVSNLMLMP